MLELFVRFLSALLPKKEQIENGRVTVRIPCASLMRKDEAIKREVNHRRFTVGKKRIGHSCDGFTRRRPRDVGQDERREELTQQKCERGKRASGLSRGTKRRKTTRENERKSIIF
jgi:hypothetical protein